MIVAAVVYGGHFFIFVINFWYINKKLLQIDGFGLQQFFVLINIFSFLLTFIQRNDILNMRNTLYT